MPGGISVLQIEPLPYTPGGVGGPTTITSSSTPDVKSAPAPTDLAPSMSAAQREAMRQQGIPTSQQSTSQQTTEAGRQYTYDTPSGRKVVQRNDGKDRSHPGQPHVEAGSPKANGQTDGIGRPRLDSSKTKVDVNPQQ